MYTTLQTIHSYWAYLTLLLLLAAVVNAIIGWTGGKAFLPRDRKISLFGMVVTHIQLLLGIILLFVSPYLTQASELGMGEVMGNSLLRLYLVEHPTINILAVVLITIGWSRHKKQATDTAKFKSIGIFYVLGLIFLLSRIPWQAWFS